MPWSGSMLNMVNMDQHGLEMEHLCMLPLNLPKRLRQAQTFMPPHANSQRLPETAAGMVCSPHVHLLTQLTAAWSIQGFTPAVMGYAMFYGGLGQFVMAVLEIIRCDLDAWYDLLVLACVPVCGHRQALTLLFTGCPLLMHVVHPAHDSYTHLAAAHHI
jgi:hypothetical protein